MITPAQSRAARAILGWSLRDAAKYLGVSKNTIQNLELGGNTTTSTLEKMRQAYEQKGITFMLDGKRQGIFFSNGV